MPNDRICFDTRLSYNLVPNLTDKFFFNSGIAQLVERSTLMRKYPRSIPGEGE
jgi:hypothetical protein